MITLTEDYSLFGNGIAIGIVLTASWWLLWSVIGYFWSMLKNS